jgi:hypothetical protein
MRRSISANGAYPPELCAPAPAGWIAAAPVGGPWLGEVLVPFVVADVWAPVAVVEDVVAGV